MAPHDHGPPSPTGSDGPTEDPWQAVAWIVAGVLLYGGLGWLGDWWLGTSFLVPVGIVAGAGLGIYLVIKRFGSPPGSAEQAPAPGREDK